MHLASAAQLTALLDSAPGQPPQSADSAWLAWLLWCNAPVQLQLDAGAPGGGWTIKLLDAPADALAPAVDWLERAIENLIGI